MSKLDEYDRTVAECKALSEDVKKLVALKKDQVTLKLEEGQSWKSFRGVDVPLALLIEGIGTQEFRKILNGIVEARVMKARHEAIEECQDFLKKHVVAEVMET